MGRGTLRYLQVYEEIRRHTQESEDRCSDLNWRIGILLKTLACESVDLTERANREAFADVLAGFVPTGFDLVLVPDVTPCAATLEDGGKISFSGHLIADGAAVASISRTIWTERQIAEHHGIRVVPRYRSNRIAPRSLIKCVGFYDTIGVKEIRLRAAHSGKWYWAQWGFHFVEQQDLIRIKGHTQAIVNAFGGRLDVSTFVHPEQFFRLGRGGEISFYDLIRAFPQHEDHFDEVAVDNGLNRHQPIPFGRAVLLTGPSWDGCLALSGDGADRLIFEDVARRMVMP